MLRATIYCAKQIFYPSFHKRIYDWWLVRCTLLMELGLLQDFLGIFWTRGERYYFCVEESLWDGCQVRKCPCEVTFMCGGRDNWTYASQKSPHIHVRWLCVVEGTTLKQHPQSHLAWTWGGCKVNFVLQIDATLMMSKLQMMTICRNFSLYMWCNRETASHDTWFGWTMPLWPPPRPPSWKRTASLESGVHPRSWCRWNTLGCLPLYLVASQIRRGLLSLLWLSRDIVQSQASVAFPPPSAECSNICIIMKSPDDIKRGCI